MSGTAKSVTSPEADQSPGEDLGPASGSPSPDRDTALGQRAPRSVWRLVTRVSLKTRIVLAIVGLSVLSSVGLVALAPAPDHVAVEEGGVPVSSLVVARETLAPQVRLYGRVETPNAARLTALISAPVAMLAVREGDRVDAGAALVQLDVTDVQLAFKRADAELAQARADREVLRMNGAEDRAVLAHQERLAETAEAKAAWHRELFAQGSIARQTLNAAQNEADAQAMALIQQRAQVASFDHRLARAEASVARAEATLAEAGVNLARATISAPFPGRVTRILVAPGELVSPGAVVVEIYDDTRLEIRVPVPNLHLPEVEDALAAGERLAAVADFGDGAGTGYLERLVGAVEKGRSGVDGLVRLADDVNPPDLGRAVELRMTLRPVADVVALPVQAVYGQRRVFLIEEGLLVGVEIERVGEMTTEAGEYRLLVRAPELADGSKVLATQLSNAVTGLRVSEYRQETESAPAAT